MEQGLAAEKSVTTCLPHLKHLASEFNISCCKLNDVGCSRHSYFCCRKVVGFLSGIIMAVYKKSNGQGLVQLPDFETLLCQIT